MINTKIQENYFSYKKNIVLHFDNLENNLFPLNQTYHQVNEECNSMLMYTHMSNHVQQVEIIVSIMDLNATYRFEVLRLFLLLSKF
jgi:hypothetical protein